MNTGVKNYTVMYGVTTPMTNLLDADLFYDDPGSTIEFSNAVGDGLKKIVAESQKRKAVRAKGKADERSAQLAAAKGLAKQASAPVVNKTVVKSPAPAKKNNTLLYVGIGVGVLALGTGLFFLLRKKK